MLPFCYVEGQISKLKLKLSANQNQVFTTYSQLCRSWIHFNGRNSFDVNRNNFNLCEVESKTIGLQHVEQRTWIDLRLIQIWLTQSWLSFFFFHFQNQCTFCNGAHCFVHILAIIMFFSHFSINTVCIYSFAPHFYLQSWSRGRPTVSSAGRQFTFWR